MVGSVRELFQFLGYFRIDIDNIRIHVLKQYVFLYKIKAIQFCIKFVVVCVCVCTCVRGCACVRRVRAQRDCFFVVCFNSYRFA